jgi:hypothetical protein
MPRLLKQCDRPANVSNAYQLANDIDVAYYDPRVYMRAGGILVYPDCIVYILQPSTLPHVFQYPLTVQQLHSSEGKFV